MRRAKRLNTADWATSTDRPGATPAMATPLTKSITDCNCAQEASRFGPPLRAMNLSIAARPIRPTAMVGIDRYMCPGCASRLSASYRPQRVDDAEACRSNRGQKTADHSHDQREQQRSGDDFR